MPSIPKSLAREPLLHFLALGAAIFLLFDWVGDPAGQESASRVVVTRADVERLASQWQRQWRRAPSAPEMDGLIEAFVREEILYREALALGLDKDDVIVRRRLGQKLEFLFKDLADMAEPSEQELQRFMADNPERYTIPGSFSFRHVYFNPDERGMDAEADARRTLLRLRAGGIDGEPFELGDRFLYQYRFEDQSPAQISRIFGAAFSDRLADASHGEWDGPIESAYGLHLVFVSRRTASRQPELEQVRDKVSWDLASERRKEADSAFYRELRARYDVEIEQRDGPPGGSGTEGNPG